MPPNATDEGNERSSFPPELVKKFRGVRALMINAASAEAEKESARRILLQMEAKYPGLSFAVSVHDEHDRRVKEAQTPPSPGDGGSQNANSQNANSWGPRWAPGYGPDPFMGVPRATDAVRSTDFGPGWLGNLKREAAGKVATWFDDKVDAGRAQWEDLSLDEIERQIRQGGFDPAYGGIDLGGWNPFEAAVQKEERMARNRRHEKYRAAPLEDLLADPEITDAEVIFEEDDAQGGEECIRFDFSVPAMVWERLRKHPRVLTNFLIEMQRDVEDAENEIEGVDELADDNE